MLSFTFFLIKSLDNQLSIIHVHTECTGKAIKKAIPMSDQSVRPGLLNLKKKRNVSLYVFDVINILVLELLFIIYYAKINLHKVTELIIFVSR